MEYFSSIFVLQDPATCTYPEPDQSSPRAHLFFKLKIYFNIILQSTSNSK